MSYRRSFKVGFWLGDASMHLGGVGPYALRILNSLLTDAEAAGWQFVVLCDDEAQKLAERVIPEFHKAASFQLIPSAPEEEKGERGWRHYFRQSSAKINSQSKKKRPGFGLPRSPGEMGE